MPHFSASEPRPIFCSIDAASSVWIGSPLCEAQASATSLIGKAKPFSSSGNQQRQRLKRLCGRSKKRDSLRRTQRSDDVSVWFDNNDVTAMTRFSDRSSSDFDEWFGDGNLLDIQRILTRTCRFVGADSVAAVRRTHHLKRKRVATEGQPYNSA